MMEVGRLANCPKGDGEIIGLLLGYAVVRLENGDEWVGLQKEVKCKPVNYHEIVCEDLGYVYRGKNPIEAQEIYVKHVDLVTRQSRLQGKNVVWFVNDNLKCQHLRSKGDEPAIPLDDRFMQICFGCKNKFRPNLLREHQASCEEFIKWANTNAPDPFEPM